MGRMIFGFTGQAGSGKDAGARYLKEHYGAYTPTFSTPLRDLLKRLYLPMTRQNLSQLSTALRGLYGEDLFGRVVLKDAEETLHSLMVVTGIRRPEDMNGLLGTENFHLVYIEATPQVRYARVHARRQNEDDATKSYEQFLDEEKLETEMSIAELKTKAEFVIENNGTVEDFHRKLDECMAHFGYGK